MKKTSNQRGREKNGCLESTQRQTKADIQTDRQLDKETDKKSYHVAAHCALNVPELHLNNLS